MRYLENLKNKIQKYFSAYSKIRSWGLLYQISPCFTAKNVTPEFDFYSILPYSVQVNEEFYFELRHVEIGSCLLLENY